MKKREKGFTLIELLVVVAIIGALAAVGVVAYNGYTAAAKKNSTKSIQEKFGSHRTRLEIQHLSVVWGLDQLRLLLLSRS